ncbi:MAG: T9SS type A sorting domain-containing protein [Bacteroidales bacterium]|nr:T9SS type A sorting domain-containing protein [Bacteroidales bacterium]
MIGILVMLLSVLFLGPSLWSQETVIHVAFVQPEKLKLDAGENLIMVNGQSIILGTDVSLSGGSPAYSYQWTGNQINEQNSPTLTIFSAGMYTLHVTDMTGCSAIDSVSVISATDLENEGNWTVSPVFPNPSDGLFRVHLTGITAPVRLQVLSTDGRVVFYRFYHNSSGVFSEPVDLSEYASGAYYFQIISGTNKFIKKVILQ